MAVTVSPKYQVVIPKDVRIAANVKPGTKFDVFNFGGRIEYVPIVHPRDLRGKFKGLSTRGLRDERDRM